MRRFWTAALGVVTGVSALALAGTAAHAATNQPIAQTGGAEITLLGIPLDVSVELNTDTGDITAVNVTDGPGGAAAAMTATKVTPTKVRFASTADGATQVSVSARGDKLSFGVRTTDLAKLVGANTWAGDVFGTGTKSTVPFTIGNDGGNPTFAWGTIPAVDGITTTDIGTWGGGRHDDDDDSSAGGRMEFTKDGFRKVLSVWVSVDGNDEGTSHTSLHITLSGRNIQRKSLAELAGDKVWTGLLCDGKTKATVNYNVAADGTVTSKGTTPADATVENAKHGILVRFATGDKVTIMVLTKDDGQAALAINVRGKRCTDPATVSPPKVNVPVATTVPKDPRTSGDHKGGDHKGDGKPGDGHNG